VGDQVSFNKVYSLCHSCASSHLSSSGQFQQIKCSASLTGLSLPRISMLWFGQCVPEVRVLKASLPDYGLLGDGGTFRKLGLMG
jgi:hypothetical protein